MTSPFDLPNYQLEIFSFGITQKSRAFLRELRGILSEKTVTRIEKKAYNLISTWSVQGEDAARSKVPVWSRQLRDEMFRSTSDATGHGRVYVVGLKHTQSWGPVKPGSAQLARFLDSPGQRRSQPSIAQAGFSPAKSKFSTGWIQEAVKEFNARREHWKP